MQDEEEEETVPRQQQPRLSKAEGEAKRRKLQRALAALDLEEKREREGKFTDDEMTVEDMRKTGESKMSR